MSNVSRQFTGNVHLCLWNCGELSVVPTAGVSEQRKSENVMNE